MQPNEYVAMVETALARDEIEKAIGRMRQHDGAFEIPTDDIAGAARKVDEKHRAYIRAGEIWQCPHMPLQQTSGIFWAVFLPGYCCLNCYKTYCGAINGTPEDRRCDLCMTIVHMDDFRGGLYSIPAIPIGDAKILPPLTITFGVCLNCMEG